MSQGEERVWELLAAQTPEELCRRTEASYDASSRLYTLKSFGRDFSIAAEHKEIAGGYAGSELFLKRLGFFFRLSALGYLALGRDVALTGQLINPVNMKSGQLFFRGSHVLPLDKVAERYGKDVEGFLVKSEELAGTRLTYGDASFRVFPFPKVPAVLILWLADEEFPSRADLLFDTAIETQLPIDVIWSIAMLTTLALL